MIHTTAPLDDLDALLATAPPPPESDGFDTVSVTDLLTEETPEQPWLIDGMLPDGGFSYLVGADKSGKSTLCLEMMLCVARGEPFLGRPTQQGLVIYLALEGIRSQYAEHFRRMGVVGDDGKSLVFHHGTKVPTDPIASLEYEIRTTGAALVIIDTLAKFFPDVNILNYNKLNIALAKLYALGQRTGCHILVLHHATKAAAEKGLGFLLARGGLGSAAIGGSVDTKMAIHKDDETGVVSFGTENRYGDNFPKSRLIFDTASKRLSVGESTENPALDVKILEFVAGSPGTVQLEIKSACGGNQTLTSLAIKRLVGAGRLLESGAGRKGDPFKYHVAPEAEAVTPVVRPMLKLVAEEN